MTKKNPYKNKYQQGGKISTQGYKSTSKDKNAPWLTIPSDTLTMQGVNFPVMAYPQNGQPVMMMPNQQYSFPGSQYVQEVPIKNNTVNRMQTIHGTHYQMGGKTKQNPPIYTQHQQEIPTRNYYELPQFQGTTNIVEAGKPWENKPMYLPPTRQNTGTMRAEAPKRSVINKAGQIARHPMTAASYVAQGQPIPDYLEYGEKNKFDNAIDIINPMTYIDAGKRTLTAENFRDPNQSFSEALLRTGLDAAMVYGVGKGVKSSVLPNKGTAKFAEPDFVNQHGAKWYSNKPHIYDIDEMGRPIVYERTSGRFTTGDNPSYNALGREEAVSEAQRDAIKNAKFSPEDAKKLKDIKDNHTIYKRDLEEWENYKKTIPEYKQERMQLRPDKQHLSDDAQGVIWTEDGPIYPKNYIHPVDADYINIPARGGIPNGTVYTTNSGKTYQYHNDNFPSGHPVTSEGISSQIHRAEQSARPSMQQIGLDFVPGKSPTTNPLLYSIVLAKDLGKEKKQEVTPEPYSDTPFYLKNNTAEVEKIPEKKKSRKKDTQHIGTGNYTVVGAETPDGQFIYHYPTKEQADSVVSQYQNIQQYGGSHTNNNTMKKTYQGQYQQYQNGGPTQPAGMYWDGKQYRKVSPAIAAGSMYEHGGQYLPTIIPAQYQQYANGGQYIPTLVPPQYQQWQYGGDCPECDQMKNGGHWIQKAVNPAHKGYYQQGGPLLPNNPSGYTDSVINANQNIPFYRDVKAGKVPINASTFFYDAANSRAMEDDNTNPYNGIRSGVKPKGSYTNGQYTPLEMGDAYSNESTPPLYFPSQQAASIFQEEVNRRIQGIPKKQEGGPWGATPAYNGNAWKLPPIPDAGRGRYSTLDRASIPYPMGYEPDYLMMDRNHIGQQLVGQEENILPNPHITPQQPNWQSVNYRGQNVPLAPAGTTTINTVTKPNYLGTGYKNGGSVQQYQVGGTYEVDDNEYKRLKSLGYKFRDI